MPPSVTLWNASLAFLRHDREVARSLYFTLAHLEYKSNSFSNSVMLISNSVMLIRLSVPLVPLCSPNFLRDGKRRGEEEARKPKKPYSQEIRGT